MQDVAQTARFGPPGPSGPVATRDAVSPENRALRGLPELGPKSVSGRLWHWPTSVVADEPSAAALPAWLLGLLRARGVDSPAVREPFLRPSLARMIDPDGIRDMDQATKRLLQARQRGERVCVYGDYDVDGVCASSLLSEYLRVLGLSCEVYIPDRRAEGYGLNVAAIEEVAGRCALLVTVDCGSTSVAEIDRAVALGLEVIVVDHHQVSVQRPATAALLNPHRPDCTFADKALCATGVAFMLVVALRRAVRAQDATLAAAQFDVRSLLDLVAVATVADMVPLTGLNRIFVAAGLQRLQQRPRPGLCALMRVAGIPQATVSSADLGFRLGPRINARGRLSHAGLGVTLMHARSEADAMPLAQALDEANTARRALEAEVVQAAIRRVQEQSLAAHAALVVGDEGWHPGVLGLVASRLVQRYHRPALVVGEGGKGSARSIDGLNLHACLSACAAHLQRFGGHPAAAGVTMDHAQLNDLRLALSQQVAQRLGPPPYVRVLTPDLEAPFASMHMGTVRALAALEPFGRDNPEVLFAARRLHVQAHRRVGQSHLKLRLSHASGESAGSVDAIAFGFGDQFGRLPPCVDVLFHLERQIYRGVENVQMRIVDLRAHA